MHFQLSLDDTSVYLYSYAEIMTYDRERYLVRCCCCLRRGPSWRVVTMSDKPPKARRMQCRNIRIRWIPSGLRIQFDARPRALQQRVALRPAAHSRSCHGGRVETPLLLSRHQEDTLCFTASGMANKMPKVRARKKHGGWSPLLSTCVS